MANLQQCSRCKSTIDISFFGLNRKKEPYKTCDNCRNKNKNRVNEKQEKDSVIPVEEKETIDKYITDINHWDREEKRYVDEVNGDIRPLISNPRYVIVKRISESLSMECYMKYKHDPNIIKYIEDNIQIRNMGYKHPNEIMKQSGEHMLHTMFDDSSDDGDVWGGKKD